ncbi:MAG: hypothetical protein NWR73_04365 [Flavobacteriales bacterium]|nr:hypothetical protein [Flavobacteriales bacterium]
MKKLTILSLFAFLAISASAQFVKIEVEKVPNSGTVPGKTYRVYAVMTNQGDIIDAVFADPKSPLTLKSSTPFYQHPKGGLLSSNVQRFDLANDPKLKYDSWFTIGLEDNYNNTLTPFFQNDSLEIKKFEAGKSIALRDCAVFVLPDARQARADEKKRILLMQLTSASKIEGVINIHGREATKKDAQGNPIDGVEIIEVRGIAFTCE